jgi:hypothetical protein
MLARMEWIGLLAYVDNDTITPAHVVFTSIFYVSEGDPLCRENRSAHGSWFCLVDVS